MSKQDVWVVIPAYNESEVIASVLSNLQSFDTSYKIVVVDDCSTDDTVAFAKKFNIYVLKHPINLGQGAALATGIQYALSKNAEIIITFDADGQMYPEDIKKLVTKLQNSNYDVVLGSRFLEEKPQGITKSKALTLKLAVLFSKMTTGLRITDTHNGLRAFTADASRKITISQNRMAHASEILTEISRAKLNYCEVPVTIKYTDYSKNKGQSIFNSLNILYELFVRENK